MAEKQPFPEGQRCQEGLRCANNCGFFGSSATLNLCSKCYGDHLKSQDSLLSVERSILSASSSSSETAFCSSSPPSAAAAPASSALEPAVGSAAATATAEGPRRCSACRKKVGLTGFKCRCGSTYCGVHRYPEQHGCCFDFKSAGRDAIARCNPLIKAEKLDKI